tara:strand:+ start:1152 stop:1427 length:276 start_codon:yes stop_codon:yes gene_type:complete
MSMFYCSGCDHLVDSDYVLFVYEDETDCWTCANCLEADPDIIEEDVLHRFNLANTTPFKIERSTFHGDDVDYGGYNHKYDEPFSDRGGTDE